MLELNQGVPFEYALYQNYPNPFNPSTTIKFALPKDSKINLSIYNILGEKVSTLIDERLNAGLHQITFNNTSLPSGIYIYKIEAGEFQQAKKMILIK